RRRPQLSRSRRRKRTTVTATAITTTDQLSARSEALSASQRAESALCRAADAPLQQELPLGLREPAPDAIRLADRQCMRAALRDHRAAPAHLLGTHLARQPSAAALAVGMEEDRRIGAAAHPMHLPIPDIRIGAGQLFWLWHENPSRRVQFDHSDGEPDGESWNDPRTCRR